MGWEIEFKTNIYLSKQEYKTKREVQDKIDELNDDIDSYKNQIKMFASSNPKDIIPDDWKDEPIRWINDQTEELFSLMNGYIIDVYKLELYLDFLTEQDESENNEQ
jgi:hypothetical protein